MATSTISSTIEDPSGNPVEGVRVVARLMPCGAFRTADSVEVAREVETISDSNGDWSLALERNAGLTPSNTVYRITEHIPAASGGPQVWTIQVGDSNQTVLAALVDPPPAAQASSFLTQASADARYQALDSFSGTPSTIEPDDSADAGVSTSASRADHTHAIAAATPSNTGDANSEGVSTSFARADHVHKGVVANDAWTSWSPTWSNLTVGDGTLVAKYVRVGRTIHYRLSFTFGSTSAMGNAPSFTLPVALPAEYGSLVAPLGNAFYRDLAPATFHGLARALNNTTAADLIVAGDTTNAVVAVGTTVPFTWAAGDNFSIFGTYEAAS